MRLRLVLCALLFAGFARPAHADLWMIRFEGTVPVRSETGTTTEYAVSGHFMYDDLGLANCAFAQPPQCPSWVLTPMVDFALTVDGHTFSLEHGVSWQVAGVTTPSGVTSDTSYSGLVQPMYGPTWGALWTLAPEYLPTGWTSVGFVTAGSLFFYMTTDQGTGLTQSWTTGFGGPKPVDVPEPTSLMAGLGAIGAALTWQRTRRRRANEHHQLI